MIIGILAVFEVGAVFITKSPRWLLAQGQHSQALEALKRLRGIQYNIEEEFLTIEADISQNPVVKITHVLQECIKKDVLQPVLVIIFVMCFQQVSGLSAASSYAAPIFKEVGVTNYRAAAAYAVGGPCVLFTLLALFMVDYFGRKFLLLISGVGMLIATVMLGAHFYTTRPSLCANSSVEHLDVDNKHACNEHFAPLSIVSIIIFFIAYSIGWGPVPWVLAGEVIPLRMRGIGSGLPNVIRWSAAALVTGIYLDYAEKVNPWYAWWTFSVLNLVCLVFVIFFVPETKRKTLEDIKFERGKHR